MSNPLIFKSTTKPIPPLRFDLEIVEVESEGKTFLQFFDTLGYSTSSFAIPKEAEALLSLIDGERSVEDIMQFTSNEITKQEILEYVQFLDSHALLDSENFEAQAESLEDEYRKSDLHFANTAGVSYPNDAEKLRKYLEDAFQMYPNSEAQIAKALFAPHIDLRIGMQSYVKAFSALKNMKPKRVVILATSHYAGLYGDLYENTPFVCSNKKYVLTNGTVECDNEAIEKLLSESKSSSFGHALSDNDSAFRIEHSVELPLIFLNHIWEHEFKIIPILVSSFEDLLYSKNSFMSAQIDSFSSILNNQFGEEEDTFFLISGDLAHYGLKFGDDKTASELHSMVKNFDIKILESASKNSSSEFLSHMKSNYDAFKICGFPPLYSFLKTFPNLKGASLSHDLWDETEQESAVSFGSVIYS